ncbi:MAG: hypothetical protein EBR91_10585, partial [Flavobacteriia bacterium]|nr:hypothetical protein [Flavobacteriia bacterium]
MFFKDVVGQKEVIAQLIQEVKSDKIGHGQMLVGKPGYGTFPLAMAFSRYLLCENPGEHDACGNCASCAQLNSFQHPDLHFVYPVVQAIAKTSDQIDGLLEELVDRFGKLPIQAQTLIDVHRLRVKARDYGVTKVDATPHVTIISFKPNPPFDAMRIIELVQKNKHIKLAGNDRLRIERELPE